MKTGVPLRPEDVSMAKAVAIPDFVIDAYNEQIALCFSNGSARIYFSDMQPILCELCKKHNVPYNIAYLKVADKYEAAGWTVREGCGCYTFFDKNQQ